ncbi:sensor histidine kinase [Salipaludibacillus sp. CUR1]|uniref:sensor histidine kinase n=1 Tax=Salipaludibacillus sp. CUR1 TaxID=2820003 RepID=UPI001E3982AC|nr:sensor histidine kinase [Salipaludibacillus sp. CUR1]MCE7794880.1 sensor histidine kinase [Salipaludibacillus sp. CUR1]
MTETGKIQEKNKKNKESLQGILWDLLRIQTKVVLTAGAAVFILFLILQSFLPHTPGAPSTFLYDITGLASDRLIFAFLIVIIMVIFLITGWVYYYSYGLSLKRTLAHIIHQLKQFQRGSLNRKITVERNDELKKLADEVNELTDDLQQQIVSMRRLLNENAKLIEEAEKGAGLEERRKLARDLHDAVSQELFAVSMSLGALPKVLDKRPEKAKDLFKQTEKMVHHAQQELRALIMHLRPVTLEGKSLKQAMESLMKELLSKHPHLTFECDLKKVPPMEKGTEEQLFRVLQEGLSNALRHADPSKVQLHAFLRGERLLIVLEDDGRGFDTDNVQKEKTGNYGLSSMKERMVELGGHLTIVSYPGKGTKLEFRVPLTKHQ